MIKKLILLWFACLCISLCLSLTWGEEIRQCGICDEKINTHIFMYWIRNDAFYEEIPNVITYRPKFICERCIGIVEGKRYDWEQKNFDVIEDKAGRVIKYKGKWWLRGDLIGK